MKKNEQTAASNSLQTREDIHSDVEQIETAQSTNSVLRGKTQKNIEKSNVLNISGFYWNQP